MPQTDRNETDFSDYAGLTVKSKFNPMTLTVYEKKQ